MTVVLLLGLVFFLEALASFLVKAWAADGTRWVSLAASVLLYGASVVTWAFALRRLELYRAVLYYAVGSAIIYLAIGKFYYNEAVSAQQWIGAALGIIALGLLA